jgi:hypothetical protein
MNNAEHFVIPAPPGYLLVTAIGEKLDVALEKPIIAFSYTVETRAGRPDRWTITPVTLEGPPIRENTWAIKCPDGKVKEISVSWDEFRSTKEFLEKSDTLRQAREEMAMDIGIAELKRDEVRLNRFGIPKSMGF